MHSRLNRRPLEKVKAYTKMKKDAGDIRGGIRMPELYAYEKEHLEKLRASAAESCLFLKRNDDFPLLERGKLALYGKGARNTQKGGTGSGEVNSRFFVTIEEALEEAGFEITTKDWLDGYDRLWKEAEDQYAEELVSRSEEKGVSIFDEALSSSVKEPEFELPLRGEGNTALYILARSCGEGIDRKAEKGDFYLTDSEKRDILALNESYEKFLLVLNVGGPVELKGLEAVENILLLSQLGSATGYACADILTGQQNPSGKLACSWASWENCSRIGDFGEENETRYKEGIYVGYRYYDLADTKADFPFGYGLSYTDFRIGKVSTKVDGEKIKVSTDVENCGKYRGKAVLQLYLSKPQGSLDQPYQELCAFAKTGELEPGESCRMELGFSLSDMAGYSSQKQAYLLEKEEYLLRLGQSSRETEEVASLWLAEDCITYQVRNAVEKADFEDWKPEGERNGQPREQMIKEPAETEDSDCKEERSLPLLEIDPSALPRKVACYEEKEEITEKVRGLETEELAKLSVGHFNPKAEGIFGNSGSLVAGAAGETAHEIPLADYRPYIMADGPAGLRLSKDYIEDENGATPVGSNLPESMEKVFALAFPEQKKEESFIPEEKIKHQYASAIPIATALAQSWNLDLAETCGDIVGEEMDRFGIDFWLAPALNIQRNPLCGRNFEYYSEDPLISGSFAAAVTKGVQKHPGRYTTIKHYAANNQESNRHDSNSILSERALREIYLKGFALCIREAAPGAVMTSYNLINGRHTCEDRRLIQDVLRSEFGHKGIVMTDWLVRGMAIREGHKYKDPSAAGVAKSGTELMMPGVKEDVEDILKAIEEGWLSREELEVNVSRLLKMRYA